MRRDRESRATRARAASDHQIVIGARSGRADVTAVRQIFARVATLLNTADPWHTRMGILATDDSYH